MYPKIPLQDAETVSKPYFSCQLTVFLRPLSPFPFRLLLSRLLALLRRSLLGRWAVEGSKVQRGAVTEAYHMLSNSVFSCDEITSNERKIRGKRRARED